MRQILAPSPHVQPASILFLKGWGRFALRGTLIDHIGQLKPDPHNARKHNPRNVGMLVDALHEVGAARSIVIDEDDVILAGNATIEAAAQAGIERLRVIDADGDEIIAVRRSGLSKRDKKRLALFDNRVAELAEWEPAVLGDDKDLLAGMFSTLELNNLLEQPTDPNELWQGMPDFEQEDLGGITLTVHFTNKEDKAEFFKKLGHTSTEVRQSIWYPDRPKEIRDQLGRGMVYSSES